VRQSVAASLGDFFDSLPPYKTAFEMLEYGIAEPPVPGYDFVRDLIEAEMAAIMDGADVEETLALATGEANLILDEQMAEIPTN
jgi:multiple sugar transport system substrate-binding protein